MTDHEMT